MRNRISTWAERFGLRVVRAEDRPDRARFTPEQQAAPRRLVDVFTTRNGSWDVSDNPGSIEAWARQAYLYPPGDARCNQQGGADRNLFGLLLDTEGTHLGRAGFYFWSDGFSKLALPAADFGKLATRVEAEASGWANITMYPSSVYNPANNRGPWCWSTGYGDVLTGGGLPDAWHVSMFGVWQETTGVVVEPPVEPPVTPPTQNLVSIAAHIAETLDRIAVRLGVPNA